MNKRFQNAVRILFVVLLILGISGPILASPDNDFDSRPEYYNELCNGEVTEETQTTCKAYREHVLSKIASNEEDLKEIEANRKKIDEDLLSNLSIIEEYKDKISSYESRIQDLEAEIKNKEIEITKLENEMESRKEHIRELEEDVRVYMVSNQSTMRVNGYVEFIMGAKDFSDIVRRVEGMNIIKRHNERSINLLREEREKLLADQAVIEQEKENIIATQSLVVADRDSAKRYQSEIEYISQKLTEDKSILEVESAGLVAEVTVSSSLEKQLAAMTARPVVKPPVEKNESNESNNGSGNTEGNNNSGNTEENNGSGNTDGESSGEDNGSGNNNNGNGNNGNGNGLVYGRAVYGGRRTESVWHYSSSLGGANHLGSDLAVPIGTPVYAMGPGIVVSSESNCANTNSSHCNGGRGNSMTTIFLGADGKIYGNLILHLKSNQVASAGTLMDTGQLLAYTANSGASTGPHAHIEIFYLGEDSVADALGRWNTSQNTPQFGLGGSSGGSKSLCTRKGYQVPCRLNPEPFVY